MAADYDEYTPSDAEIARKKSRRNELNRQINSTKNKISSLEKELTRLENAKTVLSQANSDFKTELRKIEKTDASGISSWHGNQYDILYKREYKNFVSYYNSTKNQPVNQALDNLNWAIADLKGRINSKYGILGDLTNAFNSVVTWLENWLN